jgi:5-methylcytosine-specific restriction endonuclease McrA
MRLSEEEKDQVFEQSAGVCHWCGAELDRDRYGRLGDGAWEADHDFTRKSGGSDDVDNLWASCPGCNRSRRDRASQDFEGEWESDSIVGEVYKLTPVDHRSVGLHQQHRRRK